MSWAWRQLSWLLMGSCISPLPGPRRGRGKGCDTLGAVTGLWLGLEREEARPGRIQPMRSCSFFSLPRLVESREKLGFSTNILPWCESQGLQSRLEQRGPGVQLCPESAPAMLLLGGGSLPRGQGAAWHKERGQNLLSLGDWGFSREGESCCRMGLVVRGNPVARNFCLARLGAGALPPSYDSPMLRAGGDRSCTSQCPRTGAAPSAKPRVVGT